MGLTEAYFVYNTFGWIYRLRRVPSRSRKIAMYIGETHTILQLCPHAETQSKHTPSLYQYSCNNNISKTKNIKIIVVTVMDRPELFISMLRGVGGNGIR